MQSVSALSEARAARWLIADDAKLQAMTDMERARLTGAVRDLGGAPQAFHVFAGVTGIGQMLFGMPTCTNQRELEGRVERLRLAGNAGFTHAATGLHLRLSFVHAVDRLVVDVRQAGDKAGEVEVGDANAGYAQNLFALRFGHERWLQAMVGYVGADRPFDSPSRDGLRLDARLSGRPAPGYFAGSPCPRCAPACSPTCNGKGPRWCR